MKYLALFPVAALACLPLYAQDAPPIAETPADNGNIPASLIQPIERAADYLNFYAFGNVIYNSWGGIDNAPATTGVGGQFGGGISANHEFATGTFSFGYRGDYVDQSDSGVPSGVEQTLTFFYRKVLSRRWTFSLQDEGGTYPAGTVIEQPTSVVDQQFAQASPFAAEYRFNASSVSMAYRQTARLTWAATGTFVLARYTSGFGLGNDDVIGTGSAIYQINRSTSVSGTLQDTYFHYQRDAGTAQAQTGYLTLSHIFPSHWSVGLSGGLSRISNQGSYLIPAFLQSGDTLIPVYIQGRYQMNSRLPYASGSVSRSWQHSIVSVTGGESVTPGNGVFLSSRTYGISAVVSHATRRSHISAVASYAYLTSITNATSAANSGVNGYRSFNLGAGYSYNLLRHFGANIRFDRVIEEFSGSSARTADFRLSLGLFFSSKDIPIAVF